MTTKYKRVIMHFIQAGLNLLNFLNMFFQNRPINSPPTPTLTLLFQEDSKAVGNLTVLVQLWGKESGIREPTKIRNTCVPSIPSPGQLNWDQLGNSCGYSQVGESARGDTATPARRLGAGPGKPGHCWPFRVRAAPGSPGPG